MTDGGILANFPLKYTDNDDLNNKYFTFSPKYSTTEVIGIGLDCINKYNPTEEESVYTKLFNPKEGFRLFLSIIGSKIMSHIGGCNKFVLFCKGLRRVLT